MGNKILCENICNKSGFPVCIVQEIYDSIFLEDLISNNLKKVTKVLVCPYNALACSQYKIIKNENCKECLLCNFICKKDIGLLNTIEPHLFKDISKLNVFLKSLNTNMTISTTVKVPGNSRTKRLDIAIKNKNIIYLVKVLNNLDKYNFYKRSYQDIIESYTKKYTEFKFIFYTLIPRTERDTKKNDDMISINNLIEMLVVR